MIETIVAVLGLLLLGWWAHQHRPPQNLDPAHEHNRDIDVHG